MVRAAVRLLLLLLLLPPPLPALQRRVASCGCAALWAASPDKVLNSFAAYSQEFWMWGNADVPQAMTPMPIVGGTLQDRHGWRPRELV